MVGGEQLSGRMADVWEYDGISWIPGPYIAAVPGPGASLLAWCRGFGHDDSLHR